MSKIGLVRLNKVRAFCATFHVTKYVVRTLLVSAFMDKSIAQALNGLVPTLSGPIPPELQDLAVSLLAQSRSKASSLKADEEIARSYACANLACERCEHSESCNEFVRVLTEQHRLRRTLNLPKIQPRPPCPPKVYQKLYKFLDAALRTDIRRSERSLRTNEPTPIPTSSPAKSKTPTKRTLLKPTTPRKKTTQRSQTISDIPNWIMPTIRQLCKKFDTPRAPPHVFAGVSSILTLPSTRELDSSTPSRVKIPALIIAVFFLATTRLSGVETDADEYTQQRAKALELLKDGAMEHDREEIEETDVNECLRMVGQEGWADMDWFANIPLGSGAVAAEEADNDEDTSEDEEGIQDTAVTFDKGIRDLKNSSQSYLQAGLGTMVGVLKIPCQDPI